MIEVITGPMFSGKSEEFIKRINQLHYAKVKTLVISPTIDTRWGQEKIKSRSGFEITTHPIKKAKEIFSLLTKEFSVVAIDEAQFFGEELFNVVEKLANQGIRVIVSGLDTDFEGKPFGSLPQIMAIAEKVSKETAVCVICSSAATKTYRKSKSKKQFELGDQEYEARCRFCFQQKP